MLRLVELHVRKYRDLVDGGPLRFGPGPVFLLGPNGSGKTTLLELIGMILRDDLSPLFEEDGAVELSWVLEAEGEGEVPTTRLEMQLSIDAAVKTSTEERTARRVRRGWKLSGVLPARSQNEQTIRFTQDSGFNFVVRLTPNSPPRRVDTGGETDLWLWEIDAIINALLSEPNQVVDKGFSPVSKIVSNHVLGHPQRLDEACLQFDKIVGNHEDSIEIEEQGEGGEASHDLPAWVPLPTVNSARSSTDHPDLTLLTHLLGAESVEFRPRLVSDDGRGRRRWRGFDIYVHWDGGAIHHHSELSFGQKRLIALIWRMGVGVSLPLLTDEMTNGLHAGWVQAIINHLGPRQGFHAVQNPLLLDRYGPGEQAEDIAGRFVLCTVETGERGRQWRWRSPTPEECERLWERFSTRYQPLSDVLLSEGLW